MTRYLYAILACIAVWGMEYTYQYLVDDLVTILYPSKVDGIWLCIREVFGKDARKNLKRLRA